MLLNLQKKDIYISTSAKKNMDFDPELFVNEACKWIKEKVKEANCRGAVLGVSGGVDSAVVLALSKIALGDNVIGLILDCENEKEDIEDAKAVCKHFGVKSEYLDLSPVYKKFVEVLPNGTDIAYANIKPRLRMTTLYFFANSKNLLVVGTGNKSELMVGYFTKYGDGGVDILPIGDLYKREVYEVAKFLKIPEKIINKKPSAGLWKGQSDEDELGLSYDIIDSVLSGERENIKVKKLVESSKHKRDPISIFKFKRYIN